MYAYTFIVRTVFGFELNRCIDNTNRLRTPCNHLSGIRIWRLNLCYHSPFFPTCHVFLTLCRSNLNPYCLGRKAAFFFSGHLNVHKYHYALVRLGRQAEFKSTTL
jgi:hypothetical protein